MNRAHHPWTTSVDFIILPQHGGEGLPHMFTNVGAVKKDQHAAFGAVVRILENGEDFFGQELRSVMESRVKVIVVHDIPSKASRMDHLKDFQTNTGDLQKGFNDLEMIVGKRRGNKDHLWHPVDAFPIITKHHQHNHPFGRLVMKLVQD